MNKIISSYEEAIEKMEAEMDQGNNDRQIDAYISNLLRKVQEIEDKLHKERYEKNKYISRLTEFENEYMILEE